VQERLYLITTHDIKQLQVQQITAQAVIRGFRIVALLVADVEADLLAIDQTVRNRARYCRLLYATAS
jgi:hypothetical protein